VKNQLVFREVIDCLGMELQRTMVIKALLFVNERFSFQIFEQVNSKRKIVWCVILVELILSRQIVSAY
jgi:hypothetical protein